MLYEGAIKYLQQAKQRMAEHDYAQKGILISRTMDILAELDGSLNLEKGGELAENLHRMYFYCQTQLLQANLHMDQEILQRVIEILEGLRSAFAEIVAANPDAAMTSGLKSGAF